MAVYKDKESNTWYAHGNYKDINHKVHWYKKRGFKTKREAKVWEQQHLINKRNMANGSGLTVNDLYTQYMEDKEKRVKKRTFIDTGYLCNKMILPYWKDIFLDTISINTISEWQNHLLDARYEKDDKLVPYSNKHLQNTQVQFKTLMRYAVRKGYINDLRLISFENAKHPNEQRKEMLFWQPEEFFQFIKVVDDLELNALFNVLYWCGLRIGEALALQWNDINLNTGLINISKTYNNHHQEITTPKTDNSYRKVMIPNLCLASIKKWHEHVQNYVGYSQNVFIFGFDNPLDDNYIRRKKKIYMELAEVKPIRIHDLRHSHVSLLISQGFSAFDIAKRMGHTPEMVNNVYGHWFDDSQQKMIDKLNMIKF